MCNTCGCSAAEEINPVESVVVPAPLGRGVAQFYSEGGDMATYAPSEEAEGSTPATEPTNANFSAESMGKCFSCGKNAVSESLGHCLDCGQQYNAESKAMFTKGAKGKMFARKRNGRIITHNAESMGKCFSCGKNAVSESLGHCLDCGQQYNAESKAMFTKDKRGKMYARKRNGRIITRNAEGESNQDIKWGDVKEMANSKCPFCFRSAFRLIDEEGEEFSVYEEDIAGDNWLLECSRCKAEWNQGGENTLDGGYTGNAEGASAIYAPSNEPQSSSPQTNPTNSEPNLFGAESKAMFTKDKRGKMYARKRNGRIITRNAEHEGLYACSKCNHWNRNPVDDITKCKKCGNETFTFVKRSEFMPEGDGNVVGQQTFGFNGTPLHAEEDTSFGLIGEGNDFGQMRAEYEADYALEKPFTTGAKLSAGLLTGAALFGVVGASLTALLGSMMGRGE